MSIITDELSEKAVTRTVSSAPKAVGKTLEKTEEALTKTKKAGSKALKGAVKGICLIIKGTEFTTDAVMKSITGDIKYSRRNIEISKLMKLGTVKKIDEAVTADVMKYFDKHCKAYGVKYSAMKDTSEPDNPTYMIFYEGKQVSVIEEVIRKASKDYLDAQKKQNEKTAEKGQARESVKAKLAFFLRRAGSDDYQNVRYHKRNHNREHHDRNAR